MISVYIYIYKSNRKNSKSELLPIHELISHNALNDERIMQHFISVLEKCSNICKMYNHVEISYLICYQKKCIKRNTSEPIEVYERVSNFNARKELLCIETLIKELYYIFYQLYPYNTLSLSDIYDNTSVRYIINSFYKGGEK